MIDTTAQLRNLSAVTKALNETVLVNKYHLEYQCTGDVDNQRYTTQQRPYFHKLSLHHIAGMLLQTYIKFFKQKSFSSRITSKEKAEKRAKQK